MSAPLLYKLGFMVQQASSNTQFATCVCQFYERRYEATVYPYSTDVSGLPYQYLGHADPAR